jgi:hypothetical protein
MLKRIYIVIIVSMFFFSGLAAIVNETSNGVYFENENFDSETTGMLFIGNKLQRILMGLDIICLQLNMQI